MWHYGLWVCLAFWTSTFGFVFFSCVFGGLSLGFGGTIFFLGGGGAGGVYVFGILGLSILGFWFGNFGFWVRNIMCPCPPCTYVSVPVSFFAIRSSYGFGQHTARSLLFSFWRRACGMRLAILGDRPRFGWLVVLLPPCMTLFSLPTRPFPHFPPSTGIVFVLPLPPPPPSLRPGR